MKRKRKSRENSKTNLHPTRQKNPRQHQPLTPRHLQLPQTRHGQHQDHAVRRDVDRAHHQVQHDGVDAVARVNLLHGPRAAGQAAQHVHGRARDAVEDDKGTDKVADVAKVVVDDAEDADIEGEDGELGAGDGEEVED